MAIFKGSTAITGRSALVLAAPPAGAALGAPASPG
jgi:hypothetical protein